MIEFIISVVNPWLITTCIGFIIAIVLINSYKIFPFMRRHPIALSLLILILGLGLYLRINLVPNMHRVYYDEDRYLAYSVAFAKFYQVRNIELASLNKIIIGKPDPVVRNTVPVIHGWVMKFFGFSEQNLFFASKLFSSLQIILLFSLAWLLFKRSSVAVIASLFLALFPSAVFWSASIVLDPYFVTFALIALICGLLYSPKPTIINSLLVICSVVIMLFTRFEATLFILIVLVFIVTMRLQKKEKIFTKRDLFLIISIFLILGFRAFLSYSVIGQTWCCGESTPLETFRSPYFMRHVLPNLGHLFFIAEVPWIISVFGIGSILGKKDIRIGALSIWLILYFVLYSSYYAGRFFDYQFSGSYGRFFLMLICPLILLASSAVVDLFKLILKLHKSLRITGIILFFTIIGISVYPTIIDYKKLVSISPFYRSVEEKPTLFHNYWELKALPKLPKGAVIIHSLTGLMLLHGHPAIYTASLYDNKVIADFIIASLRKGIPVYSVPEYLCNVDPKQCKYFNKLVAFEIVKTPESTISAELGYMKLVLKKVK